MSTDLFTPLALGQLQLSNRIVMAPMTRSRAGANGMPNDLMLEYYRQRAGAGMIVSEGIAPSAAGLGYCRTPGIYTAEQVAQWRRITDAVHAEGGTIVAQIMHVGRVSNALNKPDGAGTVAPSAIQAAGEIYTDQSGMQPHDCPVALSSEEVAAVIEEYRQATVNAVEAGFDGVELHCTSGYLPAQFLSTGTNQRTDNYGGTVENRCRFVLETLSAMASVSGAGRVGMRICPANPFNDLHDDNPQETFEHLLAQAQGLGLGYLHVIRLPGGRVDNLELGRRFFGDRLIGNDSYSFEEAEEAVAKGELSAVSFGRHFIANPDLPARWRSGDALSRFDPATLYTPGEKGYIDYSNA
ncbi:alkene reductase [Pseudohalioglobus lutimaris]|uniref:Alkene reductase n=1 Tax=Pseudohalioglobus lutimaris TaxID=1737061 RepID=A0A2N5X2Q7_9GAMM|nr:alkene reductase [Pseudohalioglobus lutimaris]PLW68774.1 alkene reductase [Pseudohalioglobus lutimaris]